jgi:hypothetical protein
MRRRDWFLLTAIAACGNGSTSSSSGAGAGGGASAAASSGQGGATGACSSCDGACADTANDPRHCGACGHACDAAHPTCDHGVCARPVCLVQGPICPLDHLCCGDACCPPWEICCNVPGGASPSCVQADAGACPTTCPGCP